MNAYFHSGAQGNMAAKQRGLSLVELLVAVALGLFLTWGAIQAFLAGKQSYSMQQALSRIQENARIAQEFLSFDIRGAGTYGCAGSSYIAEIPRASGCGLGVNMLAYTGSVTQPVFKTEYDFGAVVFGADNVPAAGAAGLNLQTALNPVPVAGTDVLVVHTATNLGLQLTTRAQATDSFVRTFNTGTQANACAGGVAAISGVCPQDILSLSDCSRTKIFRASNLAGTPLVINHATGVGTPANQCATWGAGGDGYAFEPGSSVMKVDTAIYYVATNPAGVRALYRRLLSDGGVSQELMAGVDNMQLEYGVDLDNDAQVDEFRTANNVTAAQWNGWIDTGKAGVVSPAQYPPGNANYDPEQRVRAVRYSLLLSSESNVMDAKQKYTYNGAVVTAADARLRQVVTGTVGIRSRLN